MNIIYLHGFKSGSLSIKGQLIQAYCQQHSADQVHLPDLNMSPEQVLSHVGEMIQRLDEVVLIGSSLGASMRHSWSQNIMSLLY